MGEIATSNWEVILFYNPNSVIAEKTLAYAKADGLPIKDVDIIKTPFTGTQFEELADRLHISSSKIVNQEHPDFKKRYRNPNLKDEDWIKILRKHPEFIREPIVIREGKTILVKTPRDIVNL